MRTALIAGASGLVGSALTRMLPENSGYDQVHILVRKELNLAHPKLFQHVVDFSRLAEYPFDFVATDAYCALGTTIAIAGSKEAFYRVDHDYVLSFAQLSKQLGATGFFVVSSMGANPKSSIFYNKVKGEMEEGVKNCGFDRLGIFRPSLLLGPRVEKRAGEKFAGAMMKLLNFMIPAKYKAIHVDKVAAGMMAKALTGEPGIFTWESDQLQ